MALLTAICAVNKGENYGGNLVGLQGDLSSFEVFGGSDLQVDPSRFCGPVAI